MSDVDLPHAWRRIQDEMRSAVGDSTWHIWLEPLTPLSFQDGTLAVVAPDNIRPWVAGRFSRVVQACAEAVLGAGVRIELFAPASTDPGHTAGPGGTSRAGVRRAADRGGAAGGGHTGTAGGPHGGTETAAFNPRFTFDQFVIGDGNRLAHAAALSVAEMPGLAYNPLFICGPPGLGKTHLLHSIANYVTDHLAGLAVVYTTAEAFTDQFVGALRTGAIEDFKARFRQVDVLLVDDVQFLESKSRTEEEFFHTFNALQSAGAQLVLTSDRMPRDMAALEERLRERFEAGLVTDIRAPDTNTRVAVLRKRAQQDEIEVEPDALERIAGRIDSNLRALEGALIRVVAFGSLTGQDVTAELADEVLAGLYPELKPSRAPRTVKEIQQETADAFGISLDDLLSTSRAAPVAWPRQVAMYLARELTDQTLPAIGRAFGGRNHTTVLHACRRTTERLKTDPEAQDVVRRLTERLGSNR